MVSAICKAKDPRTCPYHGLVLRMNEAQSAGDFNEYYSLRSEVEEVERKGWIENETRKHPTVYAGLNTKDKATITGILNEARENALLNPNSLSVEEVPSTDSDSAQQGYLLDSVRWIDSDDQFDTGIIFERRREGVAPDWPSYIRIQANKKLDDEDVKQLASLLGYSYRTNVAGESLAMPQRDTPYSFIVFADTTKTARDDIGVALDGLENNYPQLIKEGTAKRKKAYRGQPAGTRAIEPFHDPELSIDFFYDSVFKDGDN
jgi:hypothetical protein